MYYIHRICIHKTQVKKSRVGKYKDLLLLIWHLFRKTKSIDIGSLYRLMRVAARYHAIYEIPEKLLMFPKFANIVQTKEVVCLYKLLPSKHETLNQSWACVVDGQLWNNIGAVSCLLEVVDWKLIKPHK